jgi:hypothetical protein
MQRIDTPIVHYLLIYTLEHQITLHEFAVVIVRCACRKFRLIEDSIEARTSFIIRLICQ